MGMTAKRMVLAAAVGLTMTTVASAEEQPRLVAAYVRSLAQSCGPVASGAAAPDIVERVDLDGDGKAEWVIDAGRYPCANRPTRAVPTGAQLTVFALGSSGEAVPVFQAAAFGALVRRAPSGPGSLIMTLGGGDCGDVDASARCERRLVWNGAEKRFHLAPVTQAKPKS